jgi:hypothetical protein
MQPAETTDLHTRLLKCALELDESRAWWQHRDPSREGPSAAEVFEAGWFGTRSLPRVQVLLANLRARFDAFPPALEVLHRWQGITPDVRALVCHWHMQLSDPLYRAFTGDFLVERRGALRPEITREQVVRWVSAQGPARWTMTTRIQFASKLLSAAHSAGLVREVRDPRALTVPRISDEALGYLLYLLRGTTFSGTLLDNPYLRSVCLVGEALGDRLRRLEGFDFGRSADIVQLGWRYESLTGWAEAHLPLREAA